MLQYLRRLYFIEKFFDDFKTQVINVWFRNSNRKEILREPLDHRYCWTPRYQQDWKFLYDIVNICDMFGVAYLEENKSTMMEKVDCLNKPDLVQDLSLFEFYMNTLKDGFKTAEKEIRHKLRLLDKEEMQRLDEALNCYITGCNYAAIAMSVSAIEFRLLNFMQSAKSDPRLERYTLGQLIDEYLKNKKEYKNMIPEKHEHLLRLCNTYRIFSVHPKKEKITKQIATSIINLAFAFLMDEKMKRKERTV